MCAFFLLLFCAQSNTIAQSINLDTTKITVDTLISAKGGLETEVKYDADDSIVLDLGAKMARLYGNATVKYEDIDLAADYIEINFETKQLFARGVPDSTGKVNKVPHFEQGENKFDSDSLYYNFDTKRARLTGLKLEQEGTFITCNQVFRQEDGSIITDTGKITTCNLDHPHFYFKARKMKIIPNDKVVFGRANLVVEDVQTPLILPLGLFPVKKDRKSGFIFPEPQAGGIRGFGVTNMGWHFHINDYFNLTLNTDVFFGGSYRVGIASMYKKRYKYSGLVNLAYGYSIIGGSKEENNLEASIDYSIRWQHSEDPKNHPGRIFSANIEYFGGKFNQNFTQNQSFGNNQFTSSMNYSKTFGFWNKKLSLNASARASQNTANNSLTATAPSVALTLQRITPFKRKNSTKKHIYDNFGFNVTSNFNNNISRNDSNILDLATWREPWQNAQKSVTHSVPFSMPFSFWKNYFSLNPTFNYTENWYFQEYDLGFNMLDSTLDTLNFTRNIFGRQFSYNFGTSINTRIFGTYNFLKGKVKAIRHVMTPSVGFRYTPDFSLSRFGFADSYRDTAREIVYNRYTGQELVSRPQGVIDFSLQNVFNGKKRLFDSTKNTDKFNIIDNLTISSGYDILADSQNWRDISTSMGTRVFNELISINASARFSPYTMDANGFKSNELFFRNNRGIAQITSANFSMSANLNPQINKKRREQRKDLVGNDRLMQSILERQLIDFTIPWSLSINANANFNPFVGEFGDKWSFIPSFNGDISLTPFWKITYRTGYDVLNQRLAETTEIGIARSLHCWSIQFDWNPVGSRRQFSFTLRPKASILQELKLNKRNYWWNLF
jgi:hypothetical protein